MMQTGDAAARLLWMARNGDPLKKVTPPVSAACLRTHKSPPADPRRFAHFSPKRNEQEKRTSALRSRKTLMSFSTPKRHIGHGVNHVSSSVRFVIHRLPHRGEKGCRESFLQRQVNRAVTGSGGFRHDAVPAFPLRAVERLVRTLEELINTLMRILQGRHAN